MGIPRDEQETTITYLQSEALAYLNTSHPATARRWKRLGYEVEVDGRQRDRPVAWKAAVPCRLVSFRRLKRTALGQGSVKRGEKGAFCTRKPAPAQPRNTLGAGEASKTLKVAV